MKGLVIKKNANLFTVESEERQFVLKPRGTLKSQGVFVGDYVEFDEQKLIINKICQRKNLLIRPPLCNLDKIFIVIAPVPEADLLLVDKMILCCKVLGIEPLLVINKEDVTNVDFIKNIKKIYKNVLKTIVTSVENNKIQSLKKEIVGLCAFAGQSAVGKSSLINSLLNKDVAIVGDMSKKIERGKQTTRLVSLYKLNKGYIADTAGFSSLDVSMLVELNEQEVSRFYNDFLPYLVECKYRSCLHQKKGECGIIRHVESGDISKVRYENYLKIVDNLIKNKRKYK